MSGIHKLDDRVREVLLESLRTRGDEDLVILAPHRQSGWAVSAEVVLELGVERDVVLVVEEVSNLNVGIARACHQVVVQVVHLRRDDGRVRRPGDVLYEAEALAQVHMEKTAVTNLRLRSCEVEEGIQGLHLLWSRVGPRILEGGPEGCAQALHIGISVLRNESCNRLRALKSESVGCLVLALRLRMDVTYLKAVGAP